MEGWAGRKNGRQREREQIEIEMCFMWAKERQIQEQAKNIRWQPTAARRDSAASEVIHIDTHLLFHLSKTTAVVIWSQVVALATKRTVLAPTVSRGTFMSSKKSRRSQAQSDELISWNITVLITCFYHQSNMKRLTRRILMKHQLWYVNRIVHLQYFLHGWQPETRLLHIYGIR